MELALSILRAVMVAILMEAILMVVVVVGRNNPPAT